MDSQFMKDIAQDTDRLQTMAEEVAMSGFMLSLLVQMTVDVTEVTKGGEGELTRVVNKYITPKILKDIKQHLTQEKV